MLDIKFIRENAGTIKQNCKNRNVDVNINRLLELDEVRRENIGKIDELREEKNKKSKQKPSDEEVERMKTLGESIKKLEEQNSKVMEEYSELLYKIPNLTHPDAPIGNEDDYVILYNNKEPKEFNFEPHDHETLLSNLDALDFERGAKVTGSKFYFAKNDLVLLNLALINYGIQVLKKHGFIFMQTPDLAKERIIEASGFNPRGEESQIYKIENNDLNLIGTAEITMLGYHADEVLDMKKGPKKYAAMSHCFRTEAGSYGKASKGLYRVHQFEKLEMFVFCKPEESESVHEELLEIEKEICDGLNLPYRVIDVPSADLGGPAYRKYDIECWMTMLAEEGGQGNYGEITSCSNCTDYQARRLNIKYKNDQGDTKFVHTLNGTALVLSRFPIAIVENNQQEDGSIIIPEILRGWMGKDKIAN
ncbi:MAG: serine--tRNA ligase [Candidatus Magasanikbacteria bacterium]|nr:serine--tRNA ligase [Candidatus Magasanikbacteria bacterium]